MARIVIGVGNAFRRDDGIGIVVADRMAERMAEVTELRGADVDVVTLDGEPSRVVDAWTGVDLAIVVDAVRSSEPAGTILRYEAGRDRLAARKGWGSSHATGPGEAYELGTALGRLPARLVVIGVVGADFSDGQGLSPELRRVVEPAVDAVIGELGVCSDGGGDYSG